MKRFQSVLALFHFNLMLALVGGLYAPALTSPWSRANPEHPSIQTGSLVFVVASPPALMPAAAPIADPDSYSTNEDTPLTIGSPGVLDNDTDPEADPLTAVLDTPPSHGSLSLSSNGSFTYNPAENYHGPDSFTYTAKDTEDLESALTTVSLTVNSLNDPPQAASDTYGFIEDQTLTVAAPGVLSNDPTDPDGDSLSAETVSAPSHGTVSLNANGAFTYTPAVNYNGNDSFTYRTSDGTAKSSAVTVTLAGTADNSPPVANNDSSNVDEDGTLTEAAPGVLGNDDDQDGDSLTASLVSSTTKGTLAFNTNGGYTYTPNPNYNGSDSFTYRANDGTEDSALATVFITVNPINDRPVGLPDNYSTNEDIPLTQAAPGVLGNDTDIDGDELKANLEDPPDNGNLSLNPNGGFTYTPAKNYSGPDSFTYRVSDSITQTSPVAVTLNVTAVNDAPTATNDSYTLAENATLTVPAPGVLSNDNDPEGTQVTAVLEVGPAKGSLTLNANGSFTYTPNPQYNGSDSFTYRASDGALQSAPATVNLTITAVDDTPIANGDNYSTDEDVILNVPAPGVLANDTDPEHSPLTAVLGAGPTRGSLTLNEDGSFTYTPNLNYNGSDSFTYRADDGNLQSPLTTVSLTINPVNDPPSQLSLSNTKVAENQPAGTLVGTLSASDVDTGETFTYSFGSGTGGEDNAQFQINGNRLETAASLNYESKSSLSVRIRVTDSGGAYLGQTFTIQVINVNEAPQALPDEYGYFEDQTLTVAAPGVLGNDGPDPDGDPLTVKLVTGPAHGTLSLNANGGFSYTPQPNYNGPDSFTYQASDRPLPTTDENAKLSNIVTVTLTGTAVNDAPVAKADNYSTPEDTKLTVAAPGVLVNDTDVDNTQFNAYLVDDVNFGTLTLNTNGSFEYIPNPDYHGKDFFTYYASDGLLDSDTVTVTLTVTPVNDPINANDDNITTQEDTPVTKNVLENDTDKDGKSDIDFNTLTITQPPTHGSVTVNKTTGEITYTPARDYVGTISFKYEICDKGSPITCDTATVTITIGGVNDTPVIVDDFAVTDEDTPIIVNVLANDTDPDGFGDLVATSITVTTQPVHGTYLIGPTPGSITYSPNRDYHGMDSLVYQVEDQAGARDTGTLTITINSVNDVPVARGNIYIIYQGEVLSRNAPGVLGNDNDFDGDPIQAILETAPLSGTLTLNGDGSFLYVPDETFAGADSFTYVATDGKSSSDPANVNITILDTTNPRVQWMLPVEEEGIYFVGADVIELEATATDNVAVDYVRFYRWQPIPNNPAGGVYIDVCLDRSAPYACKLDPADLTLGYNQVFVAAFDKAGNNSSRSRILLFKQDNQLVLDESIFLPIVGNQYPDPGDTQ